MYEHTDSARKTGENLFDIGVLATDNIKDTDQIPQYAAEGFAIFSESSAIMSEETKTPYKAKYWVVSMIFGARKGIPMMGLNPMVSKLIRLCLSFSLSVLDVVLPDSES